MSNEKESNLIPLTGLWLNETASGKKYFSGTLGGAKVLIFANEYKTEDSQPDYQMFLSQKQKQQDKPGPKEKGVPF